ncbi:NHL repeat-containing protein [Dehalococcoidia bacterium]|nr:NHL repeat-containing protein [Dehalococcoidia bacterium]
MPWGIAAGASGDIYVADWRNDRVQKFDSEGVHLATWAAPGNGSDGFHRPAGVAVGVGGCVYVSDWGNNRVQLLDSDGQFVMDMKGEATLSTWADDYFAANPDEFEERQKSDLEYVSGTDEQDRFLPKQAMVEKVFWGPTSVKVDDVGRVYVVDSGRHRVQVYQERRRD